MMGNSSLSSKHRAQTTPLGSDYSGIGMPFALPQHVPRPLLANHFSQSKLTFIEPPESHAPQPIPPPWNVLQLKSNLPSRALVVAISLHLFMPRT
jgi:hypothetical protein